MPGNVKLPIVYVRGFAGDTSGINRAVTDPFYGFNEGSTHVRIGQEATPVFYQFESPLLRLHLDEGYKIFLDGGQMAYLESHDDIAPDSIWIHRFYDVSASSWGGRPEEFRLEAAAENLLTLIETLQAKTKAPAVHLVAHSMGGLICRCLLQKIIPDLRPDRRPTDFVDKLFTYGTPHGGISFEVGFGLFERLRDAFGVQGADIFGPRRMYEYLTPDSTRDLDGPPDGWRPEEMPDGDGAFPAERVFCLVGTDAGDYEVAHGLSSAVVGERSDGLVQIENAAVPGAHRAFVHRSHSGRYGLVNSEEGYQNLRRFLFGDVKVEAALVGHRLPAEKGVTWQADALLSVRGLPVVISERAAAHWCPIQLSAPGADAASQDVIPLATVFLSSYLPRPQESGTLRHALHLRLISLRERNGLFRFFDHLEQAADFDDILVVDIGDGPDSMGTRAAWNSEVEGAIRDYLPSGPPLGDEDPETGSWVAHIALPRTAAPLLGEGARIRLSVTPWA